MCEQNEDPKSRAMYCHELSIIWRYGDELPPARELGGQPLVNKNVEGTLTMFYGAVEHESSNVTEKMQKSLGDKGPADCRMTAAFDIGLDPVVKRHSVPLYNPQDPWWDKDPKGSLGDAIGAEMESIQRSWKAPVLFEWDLPQNRTKMPDVHWSQKPWEHSSHRALTNWENQRIFDGWRDAYITSKLGVARVVDDADLVPQNRLEEQSSMLTSEACASCKGVQSKSERVTVLIENQSPRHKVHIFQQEKWGEMEVKVGVLRQQSRSTFSSFPGQTWVCRTDQKLGSKLIKRCVTTSETHQVCLLRATRNLNQFFPSIQ